jgi:hypothetical protein
VIKPVFEVQPGEPLAGVLFYDRPHHSFHFEPDSPVDLADRVGVDGAASLSIDTLLIDVAVSTGQVLLVAGYRPTARWQQRPVAAPIAEPGVVTVRTESELERGVGYSLGSWTTVIDPDTGWVRLNAPEGSTSGRPVEVASGIVLGIDSGQLTALWLQPIFTDTL